MMPLPRSSAEEVTYEGYGPGGSAILIACVTPDPAQTTAAVREVLCRHGGNLGARDSVAYLFIAVGVLEFPPGTDSSVLDSVAGAAGAEEVVVRRDDVLEVLTDPRECHAVRDALVAAGFVPSRVDVTRRATVPLALSVDDRTRLHGLLEALAALPGVRRVYANVDAAAGAARAVA